MTKNIEEMLDNLPEATKVPCLECPWLRKAVPGHLGPLKAEQWCEMAHGEGPVACHMTVQSDDQPWSEVRQCAGMAIFRANIFKSPKHPKVALAEERDTTSVFSWDDEFIKHHTGEDGVRAPRGRRR